MSLNNEYRFGSLPSVKIPRSTFKMKKNYKGTFNVGDIIPFYVQQLIVPGDTYKIKQSIVARMLTPIQPTMDDLVLDIYYFSIPWRLCWDNFKKFMGENVSGAWTQSAELEIPQIYVPSTASSANTPGAKTPWCHMGLPIGVKSQTDDNTISVSALPFRAYREIYNYFFRNQNLIAPISNVKTDSNYTYQGTALGIGKLLKASKLPNYFTTCLPEPQKSNPVTVPLGTTAPIKQDLTSSGGLNLQFKGDQTVDGKVLGLKSNEYSAENGFWLVSGTNSIGSDYNIAPLFPLYADLTTATASTINALRLSTQTQMIYERDGMYGTRYFDEILYGHYGVTSGAAKFEKPEYLGGKRIPISMNQVNQTSSTDETSPLGQSGAFSLTADVDNMFTKSFTEHCILMGLMVVRQLTHTNQQGIPRQWSVKKRLDMWWKEFDHLGNQPVYNKEIYADGSATDNEVFGYQERFAEYRYEENTIAGELKSTYSTPLDSWHYGDLYNSLPVLSQNWIEETDQNVARTLAVQDHDQFKVDTTLYIKATRPLATFGTPGYMDHF